MPLGNDSDIYGFSNANRVSQATVGGINLETGQPLDGGGGGLTGSNIPQAYQNLSAMNQGIVGNGATGTSNSDAFFGSANAPMQPRLASIQTHAGSGANYNTGVLNNLIASYKTAQAKAQADQMAQYDSLMKSVTGYSKNINSLQADLGKSGNARIDKNEANALGDMSQSLVSRGLGNTTIQDTALRGVKNDAELQRQSLNEGVAQQKVGTQMGLAQMYGDALLSKNVQGPGNDYLSLISQLAANRG